MTCKEGVNKEPQTLVTMASDEEKTSGRKEGEGISGD